MSRRANLVETQTDWTLGLVNDMTANAAPKNSLQNATNVVFGSDRVPRKRGGFTTALTTTAAITPVTIGAQSSSNTDALARVYTYTNNGMYAWLPTTTTNPLTGPYTGGGVFGGSPEVPPFTYGPNVLFPVGPDSSQGVFVACGGAPFTRTTHYTFVNNLTVTANSPTITGLAAADTAVMEPGGYVFLQNATNAYFGRIITVNSGANTITVEPSPTNGFTTVAANSQFQGVGDFAISTSNFSSPVEANAGVSHQNRIILGNVKVQGTGGAANQSIRPNRVMWSILPTETPSVGFGAGALTTDGYKQWFANAFEPLNYIDVPEISSIVALVPLDNDSLLVIGSQGVARIDGIFSTVTSNSSPLTVSLRIVNTKYGCVSARSVFRTPIGVIYAATEGVVVTDGVTTKNLMKNRVANSWRSTVSLSTFNAGAVAFPDHYFISTNGTSFLYSYELDCWTTVSLSSGSIATGAYFVRGVADPTNSTRILGAVQSGASSYMLNRLDPMLAASGLTANDAAATSDMSFTFRPQRFDFGTVETISHFKRFRTHTEISGTGTFGSSVTTTSGTVFNLTTLLSSAKKFYDVTAGTAADLGAGNTASAMGDIYVPQITGGSASNTITSLKIYSMTVEALKLRGVNSTTP